MVSPAPLGEEHTPDDESTTAAIHHNQVRERILQDPAQARIVSATCEKGNYDWLASSSRLVPSHLFTLSVLPRLGLPHPDIPCNLQCPGCNILLDSSSALRHIPACTKCPGNNATTKHNALVRHVHELALKAGLPCEREPRQFTSYRCTACSESFAPHQKRNHERKCGTGRIQRSGPDLVIYWASGEKYYDLTIAHELSPSNQGKRGHRLMQDAIKRKQVTYVNSGLIPGNEFECLPLLSGGALHRNTENLLKTLADRGQLPRMSVISISLRFEIQEGKHYAPYCCSFGLRNIIRIISPFFLIMNNLTYTQLFDYFRDYFHPNVTTSFCFSCRTSCLALLVPLKGLSHVSNKF